MTVTVTFQSMFIVQTKSFILLIHQFMSHLYDEAECGNVRLELLASDGWITHKNTPPQVWGQAQ